MPRVSLVTSHQLASGTCTRGRWSPSSRQLGRLATLVVRLCSAVSPRTSTMCAVMEDECTDSAPRTCTEECATIWMPFAGQCSEWLRDTAGADSPLIVVTALCEIQQLGRYKPGKRRGRCNDEDLQEFSDQMSPACCGPDGDLCADLAGAGVDANTGAITLPTPLMNGQPYCKPTPDLGGVSNFCGRHLF
jgi:hypothetical protein